MWATKGVKEWENGECNFIFLQVNIQFSHDHLLWKSFLQCMLFASLWNIRWLWLHMLMFGLLFYSFVLQVCCYAILCVLLQFYSIFWSQKLQNFQYSGCYGLGLLWQPSSRSYHDSLSHVTWSDIVNWNKYFFYPSIFGNGVYHSKRNQD